MSFYPRLSEDTASALRVVIEFSQADPSYLTHPDCPYGPEMMTLLRQLMVESAPPVRSEVDWESIDIEDQIQRVFQDLEDMSVIIINAEPNEKLAYFKTKAALLEKLIGMQERVTNLKAMAEFRSRVMDGLQRICTPAQITEFSDWLSVEI